MAEAENLIITKFEGGIDKNFNACPSLETLSLDISNTLYMAWHEGFTFQIKIISSPFIIESCLSDIF